MDDKLFRQKLTEVADWKIPDTPRETSLNQKKKRGRKSNEELYMEVREEMFHEEFGGVNTTFPPMITRLKVQAETCGDCGIDCPKGRHVEAKQYTSNNKTHWRRHCITCGNWENPYTKEFDLATGTESSIIWNSFHRDSKELYQSKGNKVKTKTSDQDHCVIRKYPDTEHPI